VKSRLSCGLFLFALSSWAENPPQATPPPPLYTPSSIVNAANSKAAGFAPHTIATLFGKDLAYITKALTQDDMRDNSLPTTLIGTGVRVLVNKTPAHLYFVSPTQVNFLVPEFLPGPVELQLG
jgi:uncharacterized protein (TIGR03437 family)